MKDWQTVITFIQPHEAHMAKGVLESEGIETMIRDDMTAQVKNFYSNAIRGVKVLTKKDDLEGAVRILKRGGFITENAKKEKTETFVLASKDEMGTCPYCASDNISKARQISIISIIGVFLFHAFLPIFKTYYQCFGCDKRWKFKVKKI